jgi:TolB-like protein/DNA-binding winged helix-turn-helix (wHTH) protein
VQAADSAASALRFATFELDLRNNELRRNGVLLKLSPQQFQVLRLLAENSGQLQSREEIQRQVWGTDTFVDFDRNLNVCVAQIRATLNDDSDAPRFIQTVPKRGYRFIAPVEKSGVTKELAPSTRSRRWWIPAGIVLVSLLFALGYFAWRGLPSQKRLMIAALPFENLTGDPKEDPFADGLTEEMISQFGTLSPERLGVIGRTSVMRYKGTRHSIPQIAAELPVDYLVEGTVRKNAGRIRISARLVQVAGQAQVWTDTWERDDTESFQIQEETAAKISAALTGKLLGGTASFLQGHPRNQAAYQAYLDGRYLQHQGLSGLQRSVAQFEESAKLDPRYDPALAALADTYIHLGRSGSPVKEMFPRARAAAEKALAINETNAEAHNALANVFFWYEWNWPLAEQHFKRALVINPSLPEAHHDYAFFQVAMGRTEQGLISLRRSLALDPLSARITIDSGWLLLQAHHYEEAIQSARRALELEPGLAEANACIQRAEFYQKKNPGLDAIRQRLGQLTNPFSIATSYAFLGENSKSLDALDQAYTARNIMMPLLKTEPAFESLHGDPRFQDLARRLALP